MRKIVSMFEKDRACVDVAQQLQAVESIVRSAKQVFIRDYIDHCLDEQLGTAPDALSVLEDLKQISKYL